MMKRNFLRILAAALPLLCVSLTVTAQDNVLPRTVPHFLQRGDTVALISPAYHTPDSNVAKAGRLLRSWGLVPVVGPHVGRVHLGKYAGTEEERLSDLRWALEDSSVKAIIANRGGYGTLHMVDKIGLEVFSANPKWIVGYSDITTLLGMEARAGVAAIHGTMCASMADDPEGQSAEMLRRCLSGVLPAYELPPHPCNIQGRCEGVLVGGNLCTLLPLLGTAADPFEADDVILFVEEVGESMHNIDRLFSMLRLRGVLDRCRGVVLGDFTDCGREFSYASVEEMLSRMLSPYGIPVLCGFPAGHGKLNLPLFTGVRASMDVRPDGASLSFKIAGTRQYQVNTAALTGQAAR